MIHDLAGEGRATGVGVAGGDGPVDVDEQTGVVGAVSAREAEESGVGSASSAGDGDLGAGEVQLGTGGGAGDVEANVLEADEVLAVGNAARDRDGDGGLAYKFRRVSQQASS